MAFTPADVQDGCLVLALLLYAFLSDPTPDNPGVTEALIGMFLVLYVGVQRGIAVGAGLLLGKASSTAMEVVGSLAFVYLLWVPLIIGLVEGWDPVDIVRDVIPHIYLFVPLFFYQRMIGSRWRWEVILAGLLAVVGVSLSIRFLIIAGAMLQEIGTASFGFDMFLKLSSDPSVLFVAIFLPLMAVRTWKFSQPLRVFSSLVMFSGGIIALAALAATVSRGPLGLALISFIVFFVVYFGRSGANFLFGVVLFSIAFYFLYEQISGTIGLLIGKQEQVGLSQKDVEFLAVISDVSSSWVQSVFGKGWGALFYGPTHPRTGFSFTHMLLSYTLLKSGLIGTFLIFAFGLTFLPAAMRLAKRNVALFLAIGAPVMYGVILNPQFKFLTFGLLLALLAVAGGSGTGNTGGAHTASPGDRET